MFKRILNAGKKRVKTWPTRSLSSTLCNVLAIFIDCVCAEHMDYVLFHEFQIVRHNFEEKFST